MTALVSMACFALIRAAPSLNSRDLAILDDSITLPSLSSLCKFWSDPLDDVQQAARCLIKFGLERMAEPHLHGFIQYWLQYRTSPKRIAECLLVPPCVVPHYSPESGKSMSRAAIIFGIIALHRPALLDEPIRKATAESLIVQLGTEARNVFRTAVIELLGSAFVQWEPYIMTMSLFKALFHWIGVVSPNPEDPAASAQSTSDLSLQAAIMAAERTLIQMISETSLAIVPLWLAELSVSRSMAEKRLALSIISKVVQANPLCLAGFIPAIVDCLVRFLDPNVPAQRSLLMSSVTSLVLQLCHAYSFVQLQKDTQRLLVGGMDGVLVLFDLKSATRSHIFEGHTKAVTALAFSPDSRHICSYSFDEVTVRLWNLPSGFMSILNMVCRPIKTLVVEPALTEALAQMSPEAILHVVHVRWADDKQIVLRVATQDVSTMTLL